MQNNFAICFVLIKQYVFSLAPLFDFVLDELYPFKHLEVTMDSVESETNFSVSKLSKDGNQY